jgi:RNA polymerase sigma-70 factor (ECF subfamily)
MSRQVPAATPDIPGARMDFEALYRTYGRVVARWAARLGGPSIAVEDVVQDVFLVVSRRLAGFRGDAKVTTWLFRITDQIVRNRRRGQRRTRWLSRLTPRIEKSTPTTQPGPVEHRERREAAEQFYRVLETLPDRYRKVLVLYELEAMDAQQIADLLSTKVATVRVHLHRAREAFLKRLAQEDAP